MAVQTIERLMGNGHPSPANGEAIRFGAPVPRCFTANRSHGCLAGFVHATIDLSSGDLRPCSHVPIVAGNVLAQDFDTIWHSPAMERWRQGLLAQCDGCPLADQCRSGCQAQAMWRNTRRDPLIRR